MQGLLVLIKTAAFTSTATANHTCNLAVRVLGTGYDWTLKKAQGGYTHILVAIDKFTKWIEFKPIASLTSAKAVEFILDIIFRIGIPNNIITDLGSNFTSSKFFDFCDQKCIQIKYASVAHPRANRQVERANGMILEALRKKVFDKNEKFAGKWIRELSYVVWSLRTQPSRALH
jgi:transposase InsO family protein